MVLDEIKSGLETGFQDVKDGLSNYKEAIISGNASGIDFERRHALEIIGAGVGVYELGQRDAIGRTGDFLSEKNPVAVDVGLKWNEKEQTQEPVSTEKPNDEVPKRTEQSSGKTGMKAYNEILNGEAERVVDDFYGWIDDQSTPDLSKQSFSSELEVYEHVEYDNPLLGVEEEALRDWDINIDQYGLDGLAVEISPENSFTGAYEEALREEYGVSELR